MSQSLASNISAFTGFARTAAPLLWRRMAEDRRRTVLPAPRIPNFKAWPETGMHAAWIGHSTVLLKLDGFTILTDPVFSTKIGLSLGPWTMGLKRIISPAIGIPEIDNPQVIKPDVILLSHAHMDHFDRPTLRSLESKHTTIVTASSTSDLLRPSRYKSVYELRWDEAQQVGPATIRAIEVRHWGARTRTDVHRGYNGYMIDVGRYRVLFAGDTAYTDAFRKVRSSKPVDLALMPIGAYDPWITAHCNPEQALTMANHAGAKLVLPVHHKTFKLSNEPYNEPLERLLNAAGSAHDRISIHNIGDELHRNA